MEKQELESMLTSAVEKVVGEQNLVRKDDVDMVLAEVENLKANVEKLYRENARGMSVKDAEQIVGEFIYGSHYDAMVYKTAKAKLHQITPKIPQCEEKILGSENIPWLPVTLIADYMKDATTQWPLWVRPNARIWPAISKRISIPVLKDDQDSLDYPVGEGSSPTCDDPEVCKETLEWFKRATCLKIYDLASIQAPQVAAYIPRLLVTRMFKAEEQQYWIGTGSAGPAGIAPTIMAAGDAIPYTSPYQILVDLMFVVGQYATENAHFYCGPTLYQWLYGAMDGLGYLYLPQTPTTAESITRQFMVKGIGKYVRMVPALDDDTYKGHLFFGDLQHYNIIQHPGDGIIPLFGLERLGHTDENAFLEEYSVFKVAALYGGRLNFAHGEEATCARRTWSYADMSDVINTPYRGVVMVQTVP